jgi:hypothetical protein
MFCFTDTSGISIEFGFLFCDLINELIYGMVLINSLKCSKAYLRF